MFSIMSGNNKYILIGAMIGFLINDPKALEGLSQQTPP